jgi:hypothetical protein
MPDSQTKIAGALYAVFPRAVSPATLEEYGIDVGPAQAQRLTRELLSLSLFWARSAVEVVLPPKDAARIFDALRARVVQSWDGELGLAGQDVNAYFAEQEERRRTYDAIIKERGEPIAVASEAAALLVHEGVVRQEDRGKVLALLTDLTPVDELGEIIQEIEEEA